MGAPKLSVSLLLEGSAMQGGLGWAEGVGGLVYVE